MADEAVGDGDQFRALMAIGLRIGAREAIHDGTHVCTRPGERGVRLQGRQRDQAGMVAAIGEARLARPRPDGQVNVEVEGLELEFRREHARDCGAAVQVDLLAYDLRIGLQLVAPEAIAEHCHRRGAGPVVRCAEEPAKHRLRTQQREERSGDPPGGHRLGALRGGKNSTIGLEDGHLREDMVLRAPVLEIGPRYIQVRRIGQRFVDE